MTEKKHKTAVWLKALNKRFLSHTLTIVVAIAMAVTVSCERKPLYLLDSGNAEVTVSVYDIQMKLLWGINWEAEWQYDWDTVAWGPIGYEEPSYVLATLDRYDSVQMKRTDIATQHFPKEGGRVSLKAGNWYDMLFYNTGTDWILFDQASDLSYYSAFTRTNSQPSYLRGLPRAYPSYNPPADSFFGVNIERLWVSSDPDDYEKTIQPDGSVLYLYKINASLMPYTFIFLHQVFLLNNWDEAGQKITGCHGISTAGCAAGTNMMNRMTSTTEVLLSNDDVKPIQAHKTLVLPNQTVREGDVLAMKLWSWGVPGINPIAHIGDTLRECNSQYIGLSFRLRNGVTYNVTRDITPQMMAHPTGGVITTVFDCSTIPDSIINKKNDSGGGFSADVEEWQNEQQAEIEI